MTLPNGQPARGWNQDGSTGSSNSLRSHPVTSYRSLRGFATSFSNRASAARNEPWMPCSWPQLTTVDLLFWFWWFTPQESTGEIQRKDDVEMIQPSKDLKENSVGSGEIWMLHWGAFKQHLLLVESSPPLLPPLLRISAANNSFLVLSPFQLNVAKVLNWSTTGRCFPNRIQIISNN